MKKILLLHTGGTIGMTWTKGGYRPDGKYFKDAIYHMDSLRTRIMPKWDYMETKPLLDSSKMGVKEWNIIGGIIAENKDKYDGFVILHGTDTMAYTASTLSFMLQNINKPVILTGSQIPLCETRSDGRDNLITSMIIASEGKVKEVCIYFGGMLIRGNRATKYSADNMKAFDSPNYPILANAGISIQYNDSALLKTGNRSFKFQPFKDVPIGVISVFPGFRFDLFESMITQKLSGIVIETFGSGNIPNDEKELLPILSKAEENNVVFVVCSQCPQATVDMSVYETGQVLKKAGAVSGKDLTTEAAVAKLYYLFSRYDDINKIKLYMEKNICGELS